jgi:hypothetical protein
MWFVCLPQSKSSTKRIAVVAPTAFGGQLLQFLHVALISLLSGRGLRAARRFLTVRRQRSEENQCQATDGPTKWSLPLTKRFTHHRESASFHSSGAFLLSPHRSRAFPSSTHDAAVKYSLSETSQLFQKQPLTRALPNQRIAQPLPRGGARRDRTLASDRCGDRSASQLAFSCKGALLNEFK